VGTRLAHAHIELLRRRRTDSRRRSDEPVAVGTGPRSKLLGPADMHVSRVEAPFAINVKLVNPPEPARERAERTPGGEQAAVQIVLGEFLRVARCGLEKLVVGHQERIR